MRTYIYYTYRVGLYKKNDVHKPNKGNGKQVTIFLCLNLVSN